jgi:hypothetical protein
VLSTGYPTGEEPKLGKSTNSLAVVRFENLN